MTTEEVVPGGAQEHAEVPQKAPERKKYVFKKRDPVQAAKLEAERLANMKHVRSRCTNVFMFTVPCDFSMTSRD